MNDTELVNQIKNGNANAYRYLVSKFENLVFSIAHKLTSGNEVEDIAQEVFIKVYKNIKSYRRESKLSTWVASIAWKTSIDHVRKTQRRKIDFMDETGKLDPGLSEDVFERIRKNELKRIVSNAITKLPPQYQTVLSLFYIEEFSLIEINEITQMPMGTIKSYLSRARTIFKSELLKQHGANAKELLNND